LAHASWARVDEPRAKEQGFLGYDRLRGTGEAKHSTVMFEGITGARRGPPAQPREGGHVSV
jgi:hypothetical protein